jgi:hypothetical protein
MTYSPNGRRQHRTPQPGPPLPRNTRIMTSFDPDPIAPSNPNPGLVELTPAGRSRLSEAEDREQRRWHRIRTVRMVCTIINVICGLFAAVLAAHIIMVLGEATPTNSVATFIRGWAGGVSLGLDGLFTPANAKTQVLLNSGLAALAWLALGAVMTMLIRRLGLPGPRRVLRSRRWDSDPTTPR